MRPRFATTKGTLVVACKLLGEKPGGRLGRLSSSHRLPPWESRADREEGACAGAPPLARVVGPGLAQLDSGPAGPAPRPFPPGGSRRAPG